MNLNEQEKEMLDAAIETEISRANRAIHKEAIMPIKEILLAQVRDLRALQGRISKEVPK